MFKNKEYKNKYMYFILNWQNSLWGNDSPP